jgi:hypothetical protein
VPITYNEKTMSADVSTQIGRNRHPKDDLELGSSTWMEAFNFGLKPAEIRKRYI